MQHTNWEQIEPKSPHPGIHTRRFDSQGMTVTRYEFQPGAEFPIHSHPEEQVVIMTEGRIRFTIGDQALELAPGDLCHVLPNLPHGAKAEFGPAVFISLLSPRRTSENLVYHGAR